ncbi:hypothetical protein B0T21DRAFT_417316 [Apiosordaria backusii]|uniref:TauD/TfdA-like domain-containing protein n=1 Tax=Apiosordaria backusii TaxID=314023 RepID=A0AA39ZPF3_9PEZI|nr:hypothetical protein B0T21DRAFT_417316 [Apiosordaria backusii]
MGQRLLLFNYNRYSLLGRPNIPRSPDLPVCTPEQVEAPDVLEATARKYQLVLDQQPGDITFVNNHAIVHSREAFHDDAEHVRHLVRLWLRNNEMAWDLPRELQYSSKKLFYNSEVEEQWNITPQPRLTFKIFETLGP